jgi:hypothetical protein
MLYQKNLATLLSMPETRNCFVKKCTHRSL